MDIRSYIENIINNLSQDKLDYILSIYCLVSGISKDQASYSDTIKYFFVSGKNNPRIFSEMRRYGLAWFP